MTTDTIEIVESIEPVIMDQEFIVAGDSLTTDSAVILQSIYENGVEQAELAAWGLGIQLFIAVVLIILATVKVARG